MVRIVKKVASVADGAVNITGTAEGQRIEDMEKTRQTRSRSFPSAKNGS
jgi:hypothetical protein